MANSNIKISKSDILKIIDYCYGNLQNDEVPYIEQILANDIRLLAFSKNTLTIIQRSKLSKEDIISLLMSQIY